MLMNNADSFAMVFDQLWKTYISKQDQSELNEVEKIQLVLSKMEEHPFVINSPDQATEVAKFRIKLLDLD